MLLKSGIAVGSKPVRPSHGPTPLVISDTYMRRRLRITPALVYESSQLDGESDPVRK